MKILMLIFPYLQKLVQVLGSSTYAETSSGMEDPFEKVVFVLTSNSFQKWMLTQGELDRLFYNCDLESIAKQTFATHVWSNENPDPAWIKVWLLDMQLVGKESIAVLMAGNNPHISQQLHYAIGFFNIASNAPPIQFKSVSVLNYNVHCVESTSDANTSQSIPGCDYKLLLPESHGHQTAFVYNDSNVLCVPCKIYKLLLQFPAISKSVTFGTFQQVRVEKLTLIN